MSIHPLSLSTRSILLILIATGAISFVFRMLPPAYGTGQRDKERSIKIMRHRIEPVEIVSVKIKGTPVESNQKFVSDNDWLNGLTITIKNVSEEPIAYVIVLVLAPNEKNGVRKKVDGYDKSSLIELNYGSLPPLPGEFPSHSDVAPLFPGMTMDLQLDEQRRNELNRRIIAEDSSTDIHELTFSVDKVAFPETERCWLHGFVCRRTADGSWLIINDPPRRNHAIGKSKATDDPLPRCTRRDSGTLPGQCTGYNVGRGLHCKYD